MDSTPNYKKYEKMLAQSTIPPALPKKIGKTTTTITTASAQQQENDGSDGKASLLQKKYREPEQSGYVAAVKGLFEETEALTLFLVGL